MSAQQVKDQIREAFPATRFDGPITACDCEECTHIREELRHKRWDEISTGFLDSTCSPMLLTPEAFRAFLPAYLLRALDDLSWHSVVVHFTVHSLCPDRSNQNGQGERLSQRARLMDSSQTEAIREFLLFVQENAGDAEWLRPFITGALEEVWLSHSA
jgi:hypothetical protein